MCVGGNADGYVHVSDCRQGGGGGGDGDDDDDDDDDDVLPSPFFACGLSLSAGLSSEAARGV